MPKSKEHLDDMIRQNIRHGRGYEKYPYQNILTEIQRVYHEGIEPAKLSVLEKQIGRVRHPTERNWLQESLDFQLSAKNLGYCVKPD